MPIAEMMRLLVAISEEALVDAGLVWEIHDKATEEEEKEYKECNGI